MPILDGEHWKLIGKFTPSVRGLKTENSRWTSLGVDTALVGGYYSSRWFATAELGIDWAMSTHISHTQQYRDTVYEDVKDGWYGNAGSDVHFGLAAGYSFSRYDLVLSGGQIQDTSGEAGVLPIYATLGVNTRF